MRLGLIDLGTNSVRFDIHQIGQDGRLTRLHREKFMVRLGQNAFSTGRLDKEAVRRTLHAFERFQKLAAHFRVKKILAVGTSALRDVADKERFIRLIHQRTGIKIRVISGLEEAKLIALGILSNERQKTRGRYALIDIGGGSTEISICNGKHILRSASFPLGAARLRQVFFDRTPPSKENLSELRQYIQTTLTQKLKKERWPRVDKIIGSSGTIRAIGRLLKKNSGTNSIGRAPLKKLNVVMAQLRLPELARLPGMEPKRVDLILAGSILFEECMNVFRVKNALTTEFSLRDGLLEEELRVFHQGKSSSLELHLKDLVAIANRFGQSEAHTIYLVKLAGILFEKLKAIHKLDQKWFIYLAAGVMFRNIGETISISGHSRHSYYMVKNADLPTMETWETELIAQLCLHHENGKRRKGVPSLEDFAIKKQVFMRLLGLVVLVDSLDTGPDTRLSLKKIQLTPKKVSLKFKGRKLTGLEVINVHQRSLLIKKLLGRKIVLEPA